MIKKIILFIFLLLIAAAGFWLLGSKVTDNVDSYEYSLPYQTGTSRTVIQGYGGLFSHKNMAALDFYMPVGTPVYAARGGEIFAFKDNSNEGGPLSKYKRKANYIMIRHDDGSYGCYWHLKQNGVLVKSGLVSQGQLIGYSGSTGFVLSPHLHFSVKSKLNYSMDSYLQTRFMTTRGIRLLSKAGSYENPL